MTKAIATHRAQPLVRADARRAPRTTLDQQRATFAWTRASEARRRLPPGDAETFKNLAKGAPALIMGNGLMSTLAYYASRKSSTEAAKHLIETIVAWMAERLGGDGALSPPPKTYAEAMDRLFQCDSATYMQTTEEVLAMLRWLRQFATALGDADGSGGRVEGR